MSDFRFPLDRRSLLAAAADVPLAALAVTRSPKRDLSTRLPPINLKVDCGAIGDGVADDTAALARAQSRIARTGQRLVIPAGDYKYSASPNWAIDYLDVVAEGRVNFYYIGTGDALIFDAGVGAQVCCGVRFAFGNPIHIYAPATAHNGIYVRSVHHSILCANVHGCGPSPYAALYVAFAVCTEFQVTVSGNEDGGWYLGAVPAIGYFLSERRPGETTSYCAFPNAVVEAVGIGIYCHATLGNVFVGGTSEGCKQFGVYCDAKAVIDKFIGMDFEVNKTADIYCQGLGIEFISCDTYDAIRLGGNARRCQIVRGNHEHILVNKGAQGCSVENVVYNRRATGGKFVDNGADTTVSNVRNGVAPYPRWGVGTAAFTATVSNATTATLPIKIPDARFSDKAKVTMSASQQGCIVGGYVDRAGSVLATVSNLTGADRTFDVMLTAELERGG